LSPAAHDAMAAAFAAVSNLRRQKSHPRITQLKPSHSQQELVRRRPPTVKFEILATQRSAVSSIVSAADPQRCHAKTWCGVQVGRVVSLKAVDALQKGATLYTSPHLEKHLLSRVSCLALGRVSSLRPIGIFFGFSLRPIRHSRISKVDTWDRTY